MNSNNKRKQTTGDDNDNDPQSTKKQQPQHSNTIKQTSPFQQQIERLKRNDTTLTSIDLGGNDIGDEGTKSLSEALAHNSTLTTINLESNNIGDDRLKQFVYNICKVDELFIYFFHLF